MSLVGKSAPDFTTQAVVGSDFKEINLSDYKGKKHVLLFFYPLDFTFVCPTELVAFGERIKDFEDRGVEVLGCSIDSQFSHLAWKQVERSKGGIGDIPYPLLADISKNIAADYGVLLDIGIALRGTFLIDKEGIVQHELINNLPLGRSIDEALRMIDALQNFEQVGEVCPANWNKGDITMKPDPEGSKEYFEAANK